jgi:protocatechuate 3,4-dioxygenase beta subunit
MTSQPIPRRDALRLGVAGAGAVVLAACGGSKHNATRATTTRPKTKPTNTVDSSAPAGGTAVTPAMFENAATCRLTPAAIEGPYYIAGDKIRSDIREGLAGTQLRVAVRILGANGCTPVKDAAFEIWHCDAAGLYSGFESASSGGGGAPGGPPGGSPTTDAKRYLRGSQITDADGIAQITTIYPGWYRGRTVHIHAKVFISRHEVLTTQLYFDEALNRAVFATAPYNQHTGRDAFNHNDTIFSDQTILTVSPDGAGYLGLISIAVQA